MPYVYWQSGAFVGRKKIFIDKFDSSKGTLLDGRFVKFVDGKWILEEKLW
jgi:hypothetical protein